MCLKPISTHADIYNERDIEFCRTLHLLADNLLDSLTLSRDKVDNYFVVHLQYQLRAYALLLKCLCHANHCNLHNIGSATLNRGVDGISLGKGASIGIL